MEDKVLSNILPMPGRRQPAHRFKHADSSRARADHAGVQDRIASPQLTLFTSAYVSCAPLTL